MLCPRWDSCSVNNCPLDPQPADPMDKEQACPMEKPVRVRIAAQFPGMTPRGGLTVREYASQQVYARLDGATKLKVAERCKANAATLAATRRAKTTLP